MLIILYPRSYLNPKEVDENFKDEKELVEQAGVETRLFNSDDLGGENFSDLKNYSILYRGWMMNVNEYKVLFDKIISFGGKMITTPKQYQSAHYMPQWVKIIEEYTPKTHVFKNPEAAVEFMKHNDKHKYFVKDFVKSLRGISSSIVAHSEDLEEWISQSEFFRGEIEGGLCLREIESFQEETEQRFFILNGKVFSNNVETPEIIGKVIELIDLPFFTIDIVLNSKDEWRVVEIGDGQVSDSNKWSLHNFAKIFA